MKIIRAEAMGLCFGVRDALAVTAEIENPRDMTIHGELVHNERVLVQLEERGFRRTPENDRQMLPETRDVLVTAHGISDRERHRLEQAGKRLIDTTCPLVRQAHEAAKRLSSEGFHVLIIGRPRHVEVEGLIGDLVSFDILSNPNDVKTWPHAKLGLLCQTTTPPSLAEEIREAVILKNPHAEIRFQNTICQPTRDRQRAVERLCRDVDAVVVVGGANSNNTRQLVALCQANGKPAFHVQSADDLQPAWFEGLHTVGLTAGTSTLDETIDAVERRLAERA